MSQISLTIPMDKTALVAAATMLTTLANALTSPLVHKRIQTATEFNASLGESVQLPGDVVENILEKEERISEEVLVAISHATEDKKEPSAEEVFEKKPVSPDTTTPPGSTTTSTNIELDKAGLPWDPRIHSGGDNRILKKTGKWKLKRGIPISLVDTVEAELRALMAIPAGDTPAPAAPPKTETPAAPPKTETPAAPPAAAPAESVSKGGMIDVEAIQDFAQLVTIITSQKIPEEKVNEACKAKGLPSFMLLGARPDLVQSVAQELFKE